MAHHEHSNAVIAAGTPAFVDECHDDMEASDILPLLKELLKNAQRVNTAASLTLVLPLMALTHFIKLHTRYMLSWHCKLPAQKASLAIENQMGKGVHFARKIHKLEKSIVTQHALPPSKLHLGYHQPSLLDNVTVLQ